MHKNIMDAEYEPSEKRSVLGTKARAATTRTQGALGHAADVLDNVAAVLDVLRPEQAEAVRKRAEAVRLASMQAQVVGAVTAEAAARLEDAIPRISKAADGLEGLVKKVFNGKRRTALFGEPRKR